MNAVIPKRSHHKKKPTLSATAVLGAAITSKPHLGLPDELDATQEACRLAQEGNVKLARSVDVMRAALEMIATLSQPGMIDRQTNLAISTNDLGNMALEALNAYSHLTGQSWKRHKLIGSRAGDRNLNGLETQGYNDHA